MGIAANWAAKPNGHVENRMPALHLAEIPVSGAAQHAAMMDNPKQVNAGVDLPFQHEINVLRDKPRRFARMLRVANRTGIRINANSDLVAAVYYQYADDQFVFPITISIPHSYHHDGGPTVGTASTQANTTCDSAGLVAHRRDK